MPPPLAKDCSYADRTIATTMISRERRYSTTSVSSEQLLVPSSLRNRQLSGET